jgi:hypothetical protein
MSKKEEVSCVTCMYLNYEDSTPNCIFDHTCDISDFDCLKSKRERFCYRPIISINVNEILELKQRINKFNRLQLEQMRFVYNGEVVDVDDYIINEFDYTGLSNIDFLTMFDWDSVKNNS